MTREEASYILRKFYADGYKSNNYNTLEQALQLALMCLENLPHWISVEFPHWISVEDELPPRFWLNPNESVNVLTYGLHTMVNWYDYERGEWANDSEITHWMRLPQAPKE